MLYWRHVSVQLCSDQSLDRFGRRGDMRDDSTQILFQPFLQKAIVSSFGMSRDVHTLTLLMLSIQHFLLTHITSDITRIAYNNSYLASELKG